MKNYSFYIFSCIILASLAGCAVTKKTAPIEYHHNNSKLAGSKVVNESTIPIISNDEEIISTDNTVTDSVSQPLVEDAKIDTTPKLTEDKNILAKKQTENEKEDDIDTKENIVTEEKEEEIEDIVVPQKISTQIEEEPKKQIAGSPYINPVSGSILRKFGEKTEHGINKGINISAPEGAKVLSSASGKVIYAAYDATFGNLVIVKLDNKNMILSYAHLQDLMVSKGSILKQGEILGYVGTTGKIKQPQLHFAMREGKTAIDPMKFLNY